MLQHSVDAFNFLQPSLCSVCSEQKCNLFVLPSLGVITLNMFESSSLSSEVRLAPSCF